MFMFKTDSMPANLLQAFTNKQVDMQLFPNFRKKKCVSIGFKIKFLKEGFRI